MPAVIIGIVAGAICYGAIELLLKLKVDDALAVWGVHGMGGTWGALATGLFVGIGYSALPDGVSRGEQVLIQLVGIVGTAVWSFVATSAILLALKYTIGLRVDSNNEQLGLDLTEHREGAYTP
jgi:Amt family ammonium transporter